MTTIEHTPAVPAIASGSRKRPTMQWFGDTGGVLVAFGLLVVVAAISQENFLTWSNLMNIVGANSVALALAIGSTFVIIAGGIDLSVVSISAAAGMGFGLLLQSGAPALICIFGALACGAALGIINGILVARAKISRGMKPRMAL